MQLAELLAQVDSLKAEIDGLRPLKPEVEHRIMQKFRLDWNYHSNAIEGNSLTRGETHAFLTEGLTANGKPLKDHLDIKGHNELIDFLQLFIQRKEILTEAAIREMHKILLKEPYETEAVTLDGRIVKKWVKLGEYKDTPNFVRTGSGEMFQYAAPEDVAPRMRELVTWHREWEEKKDLHPAVHAALFHHKFLAIHPFDDGNGRMGRVLMNLILMRYGFPPVVIKLESRDPYVAALRQADAGEMETIMQFITQSLLDAEALYLRGAKGESIEDASDVDKKVALLKQELMAKPALAEFDKDIFLDHLGNQLIPLLNRLNKKLAQFDELFSESSLAVIVNNRRHEFKNKQECVDSLQIATKSVSPGDNLGFHYKWEGFKKAGTNDFSANVSFLIYYEKRKIKFQCTEFNPNFIKLLVYKEWLTNDEVDQFIKKMAEKIFDQIQASLSRKANL